MRVNWLARVALLLACLSAGPGSAETPPPAPGRFALAPTVDGVMRLDTETGVMSLCTIANGAPECRVGPDERAALEAEIARLSRENAEMKSQLAGQSSPGSMRSPSGATSKLPPDEEVDRALQMMEKFVRQMMRIMKEDSTDNPI
jgi:hypothetical protein